MRSLALLHTTSIGFYLYYPLCSQVLPKLRVFIEHIREVNSAYRFLRIASAVRLFHGIQGCNCGCGFFEGIALTDREVFAKRPISEYTT